MSEILRFRSFTFPFDPVKGSIEFGFLFYNETLRNISYSTKLKDLIE